MIADYFSFAAGVFFVVVGTVEMAWVYRMWTGIRDSEEKCKYRNGYHLFMAFSGFYLVLPPLTFAGGLFMAWCGVWGSQ